MILDFSGGEGEGGMISIVTYIGQPLKFVHTVVLRLSSCTGKTTCTNAVGLQSTPDVCKNLLAVKSNEADVRVVDIASFGVI